MDELRPEERRIIDVWRYGSETARRMITSIVEAEQEHMERCTEERREAFKVVTGTEDRRKVGT